MEAKEVIKHALKDYQDITGLRSCVVYDNTVTQSASEKNYFYKCLKSSNKALRKCEEYIEETYEDTRKIDHECTYSCHAGFIKWAVSVQHGDPHYVIVSKDVLAMKRVKDADKWAKYLSREYQLGESILLRSSKIIQTMDGDQINTLIELLKGLLPYHFAVAEKQT